MKISPLLAISLSLLLSACLPALLPTPAPQVDLAATAAILAQDTLQSQPTPTLIPSHTPMVASASPAATQTLGTPGETPNPILLTLTATLGTGTVTVSGTPATPTRTAIGVTSTSTATRTATLWWISTETPHPQFYGTLPPNLPFGKIILINKSKSEAYVSLQCTTTDGQVTILEYPVHGTVQAKAPAGNYVYVAWVGGRKMVGNFHLGKDQDLTLKLYKDKVTIGSK